MSVNLLAGGPLTMFPSDPLSPGGVNSGKLTGGFGGDGGMAAPSGGFGDVMKNAINQVSTLENGADTQVNTLIQGGNTDMSHVMISVEKADVAFQLMMQVRNKIVSAYQDIEKMQF